MDIKTESRARMIARFVLALIYAVAGIGHIVSPAGFLSITPEWVPYPEMVILLTGIAEICVAVALLFRPPLRMWGGIGLALYALCVWPANIKHAVNDIAIGGAHLSRLKGKARGVIPPA